MVVVEYVDHVPRYSSSVVVVVRPRHRRGHSPRHENFLVIVVCGRPSSSSLSHPQVLVVTLVLLMSLSSLLADLRHHCWNSLSSLCTDPLPHRLTPVARGHTLRLRCPHCVGRGCPRRRGHTRGCGHPRCCRCCHPPTRCPPRHRRRPRCHVDCFSSLSLVTPVPRADPPSPLPQRSRSSDLPALPPARCRYPRLRLFLTTPEALTPARSLPPALIPDFLRLLFRCARPLFCLAPLSTSTYCKRIISILSVCCAHLFVSRG